MQAENGLGASQSVCLIAYVQGFDGVGGIRRHIAEPIPFAGMADGDHDDIAGSGSDGGGVRSDVFEPRPRAAPADHRTIRLVLFLRPGIVIRCGAFHVCAVVLGARSGQPLPECANRHGQRLVAARRAQGQRFQRVLSSFVILQVQVGAPADLHIGGAFAGAVQKRRHIRRRQRRRGGLRPAIDMRRQHHRRIGGGRVELGQGASLRQLPVQTGDAEVDLTYFVPASVKPGPGPGQRLAVDRIVLLLVSLIASDQNRRPRFDRASHAVQATEALAQGIEACAFGHEGVEVEVGADFQGLRGDDDQGLRQRTMLGLAGMQRHQTFPNDGVFVDGAHAASQQQGFDVLPVAQPPPGLPGRGDAIDEHDDGAGLVAHEAHGLLGQLLGENGCGLGSFRLLEVDVLQILEVDGLQNGRLAGQLTPSKRMLRIATFAGLVLEHICASRRRGGGQDDGMKETIERRVRPGAETLDRLQGLQERLCAVRLVEQDQAVVGDEPCVDRPCAGAAAIGAEQQPRADLIDGRSDDRRLQRIARPGFRAVHAAAQNVDRQRPLALEAGGLAMGDASKVVGHRLQYPALRLLQLFGQTPCAFMGFVYDDAPVHHEEDAPGRGNHLPGSQPRRLGRQREHCDVQAGGLAGCGGQGDGLRPG